MDVSRVSSEWFSRPVDEHYLSLSELARPRRPQLDPLGGKRPIHAEANRNSPQRLALNLSGTAIAPTHWSFGQLASLVGAPAGINLQYGLTSNRVGRYFE
jgi:hypothetical protein